MAIKLHCYTDGGCIRNPGNAGSYAFSIYKFLKGKYKLQSFVTGGFYNSRITNNIMEMYGVFNCLDYLKKNKLLTANITIFSDSLYVVKGAKKEIKTTLNAKMWVKMQEAISLFSDLKFKWVKGHSVTKENLFVDKMLKYPIVQVATQNDEY